MTPTFRKVGQVGFICNYLIYNLLQNYLNSNKIELSLCIKMKHHEQIHQSIYRFWFQAFIWNRGKQRFIG